MKFSKKKNRLFPGAHYHGPENEPQRNTLKKTNMTVANSNLMKASIEKREKYCTCHLKTHHRCFLD